MVVLPIEALLGAVLCTMPPAEPEPTTTAAAQDHESADSVDLSWSAPVNCPDRARVLERLEVLVAGSPVQIVAEGRINAEEDEFVLYMHTHSRDGEGRRTLRADDCAMLGDAAALILALAADPPRLLERLEHTEMPHDTPTVVQTPLSDEPEREDPSPPVVTPTLETAPAPAAPESAPPRFALRFAGIGGSGLLPGFSPGVALSVALLGRNWRVETGWLHLFERRTQIADLPNVRGDIRLSTAHVRAGWVYRYKRLEVPLMAGFELGRMRVHTALQNGTHRRLWFAFSAGPSIAWEPHRQLALWAGIDAILPYLRPAFVIENAGTLYAVPGMALRGLAGLEVRLP